MNSERKARVLVFAGSLREGSYNRKLAREAAAAFERHGLETTLVDLRDYPMPIYNGDSEEAEGLPEMAKAFKRLLREHDAFAIATPEYNGSYPALVKNTIDWATRREPGEPAMAAFIGKKAAILGASPGGRGAARGRKHLLELMEALRVEILPSQVAIGKAEEAFDAEGHLARAEDREVLDRLAEELAQAPQTAPAGAGR